MEKNKHIDELIKKVIYKIKVKLAIWQKIIFPKSIDHKRAQGITLMQKRIKKMRVYFVSGLPGYWSLFQL